MIKILLIFSLAFVLTINVSLAQLSRGEVVINTFDPRYGDASTEFVVLVNISSRTVNLNGYEVATFATDGSESGFKCQWNTLTLMEPGQFILISTTNTIGGVQRDYSAPLLGWTQNGYVALRKISTVPKASDYLEIVKHYEDNGTIFTGVPAGSDLSITNPAVYIGKLDGDSLATRGGVSGDPESVTYTGYNMPSDFTPKSQTETEVQNSSSGTLPVELSSFISSVTKNKVQLIWKTISETNNKEFHIERKSSNTEDWIKIGNVFGNGTVDTEQNYQFEDKNLASGTYSYRLKQVDYNGNYKYYELSSEVEISSPENFELSQNYPNPFNPITQISYNIPEEGKVELKIYDMMGREIKNLVNEIQNTGYYTVDFDAAKLTSGIYFYRLNFTSSLQVYSKILKMSLIK